MAWFVSLNSPYPSPKFEQIEEEQERFRAMKASAYAKARTGFFDPQETRGRRELGAYSQKEEILDFRDGWKFEQYDKPLRDLALSSPSQMKDFVGTSFGYAVSEKLRDAIEEFEPGVHQYMPFEFVTKDGQILPNKLWLLNVCSRIDSIDVEASQGLADTENSVWASSGPSQIAVKANLVSRRAFWWEWRYVYADLAVSDSFWNLIKKRKISGIATRGQNSFMIEL